MRRLTLLSFALFAALNAACGGQAPTEAELRPLVANALPAHWALAELTVGATEATESDASPVLRTRFRGTLTAREDLFAVREVRGRSKLLEATKRSGERLSIEGYATSGKAKGDRATTVAFVGVPVAQLGSPRAALGKRTLVLGTPEAEAFRARAQTAAQKRALDPAVERLAERERESRRETGVLGTHAIQLSRQSRHVGGCKHAQAEITVTDVGVRFPGICKAGTWSELSVWFGEIDGVRARRNGFVELLPPAKARGDAFVFMGFWPEHGPRSSGSQDIKETIDRGLSAWRTKYPDLARRP